MAIKVAALAGGVGGAKFADGLAQVLPPDSLSVIVNSGDDFEHLGLLICPDLDTITYTLAGLANPETGWGRESESWNCLDTIAQLGGETWFRLGDLDLGLHLVRTARIRNSERLSAVTRDFCRRFGVAVPIFPMTDDRVRTVVETEAGLLDFQQYFVRESCEPVVRSLQFQGAGQAKAAEGALEALENSDVVVICPSNPWLSIDPILAVPDLQTAISRKPCYAISPIIGGESVRGPAAKIYRELGFEPSPMAVAEHYQEFLTGMVIDLVDQAYHPQIVGLGLRCLVAQTLMKTRLDRLKLAEEVLSFMGEQEGF